MKKKIIVYLLVGLLATSFGCSSPSSSASNQPDNGEIDTTFAPATPEHAQTTPIEPVKTEEQTLLEDGWSYSSFRDGRMPDCYNYSPASGSLDNELRVSVGTGTDVAIKVMSYSSEKCVRYVYINSGSTYSIKNIPEDSYYLKIAYGKDWMSKTENGQCMGKFLSNALYKKGDEVLDFKRQKADGGYQIPSFSLKLDVVAGSDEEGFSSSGISEGEFND